MKKRVASLFLCVCMALALLPTTALAATILSGAYCQVSEPQAGKPLPTDVKLRALSYAATLKNASITNYTWDGPLDANGNAIAGNTYTITITIEVNADSQAKFSTKSINANASQRLRVNAKGGNLISVTQKKLVYSYSFDLGGDGKAVDYKAIEKAAENHAEELASRWSLAEASAVENYPLGYPITLVVNEETLTEYLYDQDMDWLINSYTGGAELINKFFQEVNYYEKDRGHAWEDNVRLDTLDGEVIETRGLSVIGDSQWTYQHYRVTRVVYDFPRLADPSIARFPNCKELWLSPKCDIEGILRTIGNYKYGDVGRVFGTEDCTIFIPDTLYPNGPTYTDHPAPGCKVMLYSGDDVYAAARAGKEAAREWCTDHSYTRAYISEDRQYTGPSCRTDARFYYTCSKCGKIERNPNHTFYPTAGSWDSAEDGGKGTAHSFKDKVISDEHFLGLNADSDRVYLYVCSVCGKDWRQTTDNSKLWASDGGAYYKNALAGATVGDDYNGRAYAISKNDYISAKMDSWATWDVQAASEKGLVDKALMGDDYTGPINRLQFCSVAVKLAEKMAGKTITPAAAGTFTDTDSEYALKASAAGITTGITPTTFDPYGALTRQQMATFLYRALQWVKANSDVEYTVWDSKLGYYSDAGQIDSWATQSMAFMNALGLIKGTTDTTLSPNGACTIEQALMVAYRSLNADRIGWYQNTGADNYGERHWISSINNSNNGAPWRNLRPIKER